MREIEFHTTEKRQKKKQQIGLHGLIYIIWIYVSEKDEEENVRESCLLR